MKIVQHAASCRPPSARILFISLVALAGALIPRPSRAEALGVTAGIAPVAGMVERIGGGRVVVDMLVPPGQDPHGFAPTPRQVLALRRAKLLVVVGLPFEEQLARRVGGELPGLRVVDAAAAIPRRAIGRGDEGHDHHDHAERDSTERQHIGQSGATSGANPAAREFLDPHVWLSPPLLKTMSAAIADALAEADPAGKEHYAENVRRYHEQVDAVHRRIAERLQPHRGKAIYVFHPALGYFADAYGLRQEVIEADGKTPSPRQLREVVARARADRAKLLVVEPQFDRRGAEVVAQAIGARILVFDPVDRDVLGALDALCERLAAGL